MTLDKYGCISMTKAERDILSNILEAEGVSLIESSSEGFRADDNCKCYVRNPYKESIEMMVGDTKSKLIRLAEGFFARYKR